MLIGISVDTLHNGRRSALAGYLQLWEVFRIKVGEKL